MKTLATAFVLIITGCLANAQTEDAKTTSKPEWEYASYENPLALFPKSAFGYWAYEQTEKIHQKNIIPFIQEWKDRDLPLSGILIEPCWQHDYNDLQWNRNYPEPEKMIREMNAMGISIGLWENGWLTPNCTNWEEAWYKGFLIPNSGNNWVGTQREKSLKFNTKNPECIDWWMMQHEPLLDMNVVAFKLDAGLSPSGREGSLYLSAPFAKKAEQYSNKRILALKCWGGWDRDPEEVATGLWLGDPLSIWQACSDNLLASIINGLTGQWFFAPEIGALDGRKGYKTSPELFIRWTQWGMCAPHPSAMGGYSGHWPWKYGKECEDNFRIYAKWRMRMMPYVYSYNWNAWKTKEPLMRALAIDFPDDPNCYFAYYKEDPLQLISRSKKNPHDFIDIEELDKTDSSLFAEQENHQFMFGREMLVAPVVWEGLTARDVYLPAGTEWIDYKDGKTVYKGGQTLKDYPAPLDEMPRFVRAGSVIPMGPDMHSIDKKPLDELTLDIYPSVSREASFTLYEDDGISLEYRKGEYAITEIQCSPLSGNDLTVEVDAVKGYYTGMVEQRRMILSIHLMNKPSRVTVDGNEVTDWNYDADNKLLRVVFTHSTDTAAKTVVYL